MNTPSQPMWSMDRVRVHPWKQRSEWIRRCVEGWLGTSDTRGNWEPWIAAAKQWEKRPQ